MRGLHEKPVSFRWKTGMTCLFYICNLCRIWFNKLCRKEIAILYIYFKFTTPKHGEVLKQKTPYSTFWAAYLMHFLNSSTYSSFIRTCLYIKIHMMIHLTRVRKWFDRIFLMCSSLKITKKPDHRFLSTKKPVIRFVSH